MPFRRKSRHQEAQIYRTGVGQDANGDWYIRMAVKHPGEAETSAIFRADEVAENPRPVYRFAARAGVAPGSAMRLRIKQELERPFPTTRDFTVVSKVGWTGSEFVTPRRVYGPRAGEVHLALGDRADSPKWKRSGSLRSWKDSMRAAGQSSSLLVFATCLAFVGPLLPILRLRTMGFMLVGPTCLGKTTLAVVAGTVWGGAEEQTGDLGFAETWLKTPEAFDEAARQHRHCLLILDETKLADRDQAKGASVVANIIFRLANDVQKDRYNEPRTYSEVRVPFLVTSNATIVEMLTRAGIPYDRSYAARLIELPVSPENGIFDQLPAGTNPATFADQLCVEARKDAGTAIHLFLKKLAHTQSKGADAFAQRLVEQLNAAKRVLGATDLTQEHAKVATAFAAVLVGGKLAQEFGVIPWSGKRILKSIRRVYRRYQSSLAKAAVRADPVEPIRDYIKRKHLQFVDCSARKRLRPLTDVEFDNALGFITRNSTGEVEFTFSPSRFRKLAGRCPSGVNSVLRALMRQGLLVHDHGVKPGSNKYQTKRSVRTSSPRDRVYVVGGRIN